MSPSVLIGLLLITALHAFDEMVLIIALPTIASDLNSGDWYGLIIASYILASIIGMAWAGKEMDLKGPLKVLYTAAVLFFIGLLLAIFSWDTKTFIFARILQGIGGGMGWTISYGLISLMSKENKRSQAIAILDIAWVVPSLLAPIIGGYLVDYLTWRWIFIVQFIPLFLALFLVAPRIRKYRGNTSSVRNSGEKHNHFENNSEPERESSTLLRATRIALGIGLFLYILGTTISWYWILLIASLWYVFRPLNQSMPDAWLRLETPLSIALIISCLSAFVFYAMEAYQPLYFIEVKGLSTMESGLILTCASCFWVLGSQLTAKDIFFKSSYSLRLLFGSAILCVGVLGLWLTFSINHSVYWAYPCWAQSGFGMGIIFNTARTLAMKHTKPGQDGLVSAAMSLSISIGLGLATGLGGALKNQLNIMEYSLTHSVISIWLMAICVSLFSWLLLLWHHRKASLP